MLVWGASCASFGGGGGSAGGDRRGGGGGKRNGGGGSAKVTSVNDDSGGSGVGGGGVGGDETGTFLAGSDGGPVFKCLMHHTPTMMVRSASWTHPMHHHTLPTPSKPLIERVRDTLSFHSHPAPVRSSTTTLRRSV
jgi:hypothetical protein